jgi:hypothetical protein
MGKFIGEIGQFLERTVGHGLRRLSDFFEEFAGVCFGRRGDRRRFPVDPIAGGCRHDTSRQMRPAFKAACAPPWVEKKNALRGRALAPSHQTNTNRPVVWGTDDAVVGNGGFMVRTLEDEMIVRPSPDLFGARDMKCAKPWGDQLIAPNTL